MISFLRWSGRIVFVLLLAGLIAGGVVIVRFQDWRTEKLAALDAGSRVVETARGPVEYAERGAGQPLLIFHGAPGGYDQALVLGASLAESGFRVIAPSRPGFLRTPLTTGLLFEDQAETFAALLETLGIERVAVLGFSTGAQVAARFAARHPERVSALVLVSPITIPYVRDPAREPRRLLPEAALFDLTGDMGSWLAVRAAADDPVPLLDQMLARDTTLDPAQRAPAARAIAADPGQLAFFRGFIDALAPLSPRETGTRNDLLLVRALDPAGFDKITAPTLVLIGADDSGRTWVNPKPITEALPAARVREVAGAGHLVWLGPNAASVRDEIRAFLTPAAAP